MHLRSIGRTFQLWTDDDTMVPDACPEPGATLCRQWWNPATCQLVGCCKSTQLRNSAMEVQSTTLRSITTSITQLYALQHPMHDHVSYMFVCIHMYQMCDMLFSRLLLHHYGFSLNANHNVPNERSNCFDPNLVVIECIIAINKRYPHEPMWFFCVLVKQCFLHTPRFCSC